jgi:hypothetical protein
MFSARGEAGVVVEGWIRSVKSLLTATTREMDVGMVEARAETTTVYSTDCSGGIDDSTMTTISDGHRVAIDVSMMTTISDDCHVARGVSVDLRETTILADEGDSRL